MARAWLSIKWISSLNELFKCVSFTHPNIDNCRTTALSTESVMIGSSFLPGRLISLGQFSNGVDWTGKPHISLSIHFEPDVRSLIPNCWPFIKDEFQTAWVTACRFQIHVSLCILMKWWTDLFFELNESSCLREDSSKYRCKYFTTYLKTAIGGRLNFSVGTQGDGKRLSGSLNGKFNL